MHDTLDSDPSKTGIKQRGFKFELDTGHISARISVDQVRALVNDLGIALNSAIENCLDEQAWLMGVDLDVVQPEASDAKPIVRLLITRKDRLPEV